jgi:hypothetical protein
MKSNNKNSFSALATVTVLTAAVAALAISCGRPAPEADGPGEIRGERISAPITEVAVAAKPEPEVEASTAPAAEPASPETPAASDPAATAAAPPPPPPLPSAETAAAPAPATQAAAKSPPREDEYMEVGFDKLASFEYAIPDEPIAAAEGEGESKATTEPDQIPQEIKAFDKRRVALQGFMLPLKVENGLITELLIMRDQSMCCYGTVPKINEWVSVRMTQKGVKPIMDQAVTLYGMLKVGEVRENGYLVGIYEMDGHRMAGPLDL